MQRFLSRLTSLDTFDGRQAQLRMAPLPRPIVRGNGKTGRPRVGAVLVLLYQKHGQPYVVLTKRPDGLRDHSGQVSFPGGKQDPGETLQQTALRETCEEIGVCAQQVAVIGPLTPLYIPPSDFDVHPFVAWHQGVPDFTPEAGEVERIIEVPIELLLKPDTRRVEPWSLRGHTIDVPYFAVDAYKVWGATAMMLSDLVERWRYVAAAPSS